VIASSNPGLVGDTSKGAEKVVALKGRGFSRRGNLSPPYWTFSAPSLTPGSLVTNQGREGANSNPESGLTLIELIICVTIVAVLASAAIPVARFQVKRQKERELRRDLWEMRDAIDRYKDAADKGAMQIKADSLGYPPDLDTLVNGVEIQDKKVKFLRRIPVDPMTGNTDWGLRSNQDDADSDSFGGQNVFNVYTKSQGTALDGTKYSTW
jgi:general secretion pathway protein G